MGSASLAPHVGLMQKRLSSVEDSVLKRMHLFEVGGTALPASWRPLSVHAQVPRAHAHNRTGAPERRLRPTDVEAGA